MREIDLIPASYRYDRARARWLARIAGAAAILIASTLLARIWLNASVADVRAHVAELDLQQAAATLRTERIAELEQMRGDYRQRLHVLEGLRSGTAARDLFHTVDDPLVGERLWFRDWQFRRAGVTDAEGRAVETGYFLVVPDASGPAPSWRVETHMTIAGQAEDHAALSDYVTRLIERPEVESVRIRRTDLMRYATRSLVDFDLAVVINRRVIE